MKGNSTQKSSFSDNDLFRFRIDKNIMLDLLLIDYKVYLIDFRVPLKTILFENHAL